MSTESPAGAAGPQECPLRVLLAMPRPLLTLLDEGEWVLLTAWDAVDGLSEVLPLHRIWKIEVVETALRGSGTAMAVCVLYHPTYDNLREALGEGYDVVVVDTHGGEDGTLYFEGPHGESHPIPPDDLGKLLMVGGVRLAVFSACYSAAACQALHTAGIPAVVGMSETVREDAARAYLNAFLGHLARGDRLEEAHDCGRDVLRERWGARLGEDELPRLAAPAKLRHERWVEFGVTGDYVQLQEPPVEPRPPALPIRLRGRATDQVVVQSKLLSVPPTEGVSPLVTLYGFGGVGKTALAQTVAYWCWERAIFPGGVRFVRLVKLCVELETLADQLLRELRVAVPALGPSVDEEIRYRDRVAALCGALQDRPTLLVLDNFETAHEGKNGERNLALVAELRERCPGLHILVTSRRAPLGFAGEQPYELKPLAQKAAVELFRDRALDAGKMLLHAERTIVAEICELLDCVPLHIRLVATHMCADESPAAILDGLRDEERGYHLTAVDLPDMSPHYRSRELSFRYTYDHLDEHGRRLWAVMAGVFAGAPGRADVREIYAHFKADLSLDALLLWSVVESVDGRHHMFDSAREFGQARLAEGVLGEEENDFRARHASYYLIYAQKHKDDYTALEQALLDILAGFDFVAAGATRDDEAVQGYLSAMKGFLVVQGYGDESARWLQQLGE
ncbi:MAG: NACHT domain-containing protein [Anaerolineae bacterium]|nr:NACHT domain-containing protein [Anaerolineae bacterium]